MTIDLGRELRRTLLARYVVVLSIGVFFATGCSERPSASPPAEGGGDRLVVGQLATELVAIDSRGKRLDLEVSLDELVERRVATSRALALIEPTASPEARRRAARLKVDARLLPDGFTGVLHAFVEARATQTGSIPLSAHLDAAWEGAPEGGALTAKAYVDHLERAVNDAIHALDEQAALLFSGNETLVSSLSHEERDIRAAAVRTLGERRARDAVDPLCRLLQREKTEVGQAAVGALVAIGDAKAVPCLIDWAGTDERRLILITDPLATIGGSEARAFLEMIAAGHESHTVKLAGEEALRRIDASSKSRTSRDQRSDAQD